MKKISLICLAGFLGLVSMSSCAESENKKDQEIAYKIENKEALTPEDYSRMIDYVGEYAEKAQKYVDMTINGEDTKEATEGMDLLKQEYPLVDTFRNCIRLLNVDQLSDRDVEKINKYAGYVEFTAPAGFTIQTDPKVAGLEEAVPDSVNGVIAGAVDSVAVKR